MFPSGINDKHFKAISFTCANEMAQNNKSSRHSANFRDITKLEEKVCKGFDENIKMGNVSPKYHILHRAGILI